MGSDDKSPEDKSPPGSTAPGARCLPAIAAKADDLEEIKKKADDLLEIKKAVEDAASVSGGLWLSYLFVLFYLATAAGAVTHADLLLENPVKLPFLNVELPLLAFFALAPFMVLIIHVYALMHFIMLGKKASRFHDALHAKFGSESEKEIRDKLRRLLPSNIFVQILAGPPELRNGFFGAMLKLIAVATLIALPVLVLLLLQIEFLPFHDLRITWAQRAALFLDIVLLWPLRPPILANLDIESPQRAKLISRSLRVFSRTAATVLSIATIWLSLMLATIPNEWRSGPLFYVAAIEPKALNELVFGVVDSEKGIVTGNWPSNTLRLQGFDIYEALKVDDPKKLDWKDHTFDLHSRRLEGVVFDRAKLGKVDLREAHLEGASLRQAQLQGASLDGAQLQGASLGGAELQGASLERAQLQGASLDGAELQGAALIGAQLQGASLFLAQLQGAVLDGAHLQGASLERAQLQGASLGGAQLQGASLDGAELQGASLDAANLNAADLSHAFLWRAQWAGVQVELGGIRLEKATWDPV
ncbi:MAG TPA: pentapeptide repeat-containing protein, partial [Methylocella sp.]|nr:pentapeptide repeat-containing protein [Methylocella sp.]